MGLPFEWTKKWGAAQDKKMHAENLRVYEMNQLEDVGIMKSYNEIKLLKNETIGHMSENVRILEASLLAKDAALLAANDALKAKG